MSPAFIASDYWYSVVMTLALERSDKGEATVILILLRPFDFVGAPFSKLKMLPKEDRFVTRWDDQDEAYMHIRSEIRRVICNILGINEDLRDLHAQHHLEPSSQDACPYLGLEAYSEQDASLFFGRDDYIVDLMYKLSHDQRLLLVLGPTGSGKTSVVQAGLIPLLTTKNIPACERSWRCLSQVFSHR